MPLSQSGVIVFDEEENVLVTPPPPPISPAPPIADYVACPWETQRVALDLPVFPIVVDSGFLFLNLNTHTGAPVDPIAQAWVVGLLSAEDRYGIGLDALTVFHACEGVDVFLP